MASAWSYPLKTLSKWENTELPLITNADYQTFKWLANYRSVYSVLRASTYYGGRDVGMGAHEWIDIATDVGTPVYASYQGEVTYAWYNGNWGNVIVIKHQWEWEIYYTVYAHLNAIYVSKGQVLKEGDIIGEVGDTGNATGPHLHFQIDTDHTTLHPFYPVNCEGSISEVVNQGNCIDQIQQNTLDPIYFLEVTTKKQPKENAPLFIDQANLLFSWFHGWFLEWGSLGKLVISTSWENNGTFLSDEISIEQEGTEITITPNKIKALGNHRQILFQGEGDKGVTMVTIKYGDEEVLEFLVILGTKEQIEKRKSNKVLCELLEEEFHIIC